MTKVRLIVAAGLVVLLALTALGGCRSAHTTSAILYIGEQQYDKAVKVIHDGFEYRDDEPDAFFYLGEAHSRLAEVAVQDNNYLEAKKNYELSYQHYMRAKEIDFEKFEEQSNLAMQHNFVQCSREGSEQFQDANFEQAEGFFRLAFAALPDSISSIKNIARMKMVQAQSVADPQPLYLEALELLDQVLAVKPGAYALQADKASVLVKLDRHTEADQIYRDLVREHGHDAPLLIDVANLAVDLDQFERAAALFLQIIDLYANDDDPDNDVEETKFLQVNAATWLAREDIRRYDESLELLDQALNLETFPTRETLSQKLKTHYDYAYWLKGQAEAEQDPPAKTEFQERASEQFRQGVHVGNALVDQYMNYSIGYYYLALCQFELGDNAAAEQNMEKFRELGIE